MGRSDIHHNLYVGILAVIAASMPLSHFVMGLASLLLLLNWIAEWNWKEKRQCLRRNRYGLVLAALFLLFCTALLQTDDWRGGLGGLASKLPFLFGPLIITSSRPVTGKDFRCIAGSFIAGTLFGCIYTFGYGMTHEVADIREISVFIDHIRFSLCIDLAIVFCIRFLFTRPVSGRGGRAFRGLCAMAAPVMAAYLFYVQTLTGIAILLVVGAAGLLYGLVRLPRGAVKRNALVLLSLLLAAVVVYIGVITRQYFHNRDTEIVQTRTALGNDYEFDAGSIVENGRLTGYYVCRQELRAAWAVRSDTAYDALLEQTLIRYLNSKGLHKDYAGVMALSARDVGHVERAVANEAYTRPFGLRRALYPTFFSLSAYRKYHSIDDASLLQRVELWKASWRVVRRHWATGVGLGDHKAEIDAQLALQQSPIAHRLNRGSHNQFLTYWLTGGIVMLLYFLFVLAYPFCALKKRITFLYIAFFLILFISMFTEDTLEAQTGKMLYTVFGPLLLGDGEMWR